MVRDKAFYKVYTFRRECVDVYGILGFHVEMDDVLRRLTDFNTAIVGFQN